MYTAILHIPRGYRADTETAIYTIEAIGHFRSIQAAEKAARKAVQGLKLKLKDELQPYAHYQIQPKEKAKAKAKPKTQTKRRRTA